MAVRTITTIEATDDLDGKKFDPEKGEGYIGVTIVYDGKIYKLDLRAENKTKLDGMVAGFTDKAQMTGRWVDPQVFNEWCRRVRVWVKKSQNDKTIKDKRAVTASGKPQDFFIKLYEAANPDDLNPYGSDEDDEDE